MGQLITGTAPLSYQGVQALTPPNFVNLKRVPTPTDINFVIGTIWLYTNPTPTGVPTNDNSIFQLVRLANPTATQVATWVELYPNTPTGIVVTNVLTDAGVIAPIAGQIQIIGGNNINTVASAPSVMEINLNNNVTIPGVLTLSALGLGVVQSSATGILSSSNGIDGQVLIAATGLAPQWRNITAGANVTITNAANSITISSAGGGGGGNVTLTGNVSNATSVAGVINVLGTANQITTTGDGVQTLTISVPAVFIAPGSIASTTTITAATGLTVTAGNLVVSAGNITASGTMTAGGDITSTAGDITAVAGDFLGGGNLAVTGSVTAGNGFAITAGTAVFNNSIVDIYNHENNPSPATLRFTKDRLGAAVQPGDDIAALIFRGFDGTSNFSAAAIFSVVSGTVALNRVATDLEFFTHPDAPSVSSSLRMVIAPTGEVTINAPDSGVGLTIGGGGEVITAGDLTLTAGNVNVATPNAGATQGVYNVNALPFLHNFGTHNTFVGQQAGNFTLTAGVASDNTAVGFTALAALTTGASNAAFGDVTLNKLTIGSFNVALGTEALQNLLTGVDNVAIGFEAGNNYVAGESDNILIANVGVAAESNTIRIGTQGAGAGQQNRAFMAGIYNTAPGGTNQPVFIDNTGQIGTRIPTANGQLLIGAATGATTWANLLSADGSVIITNTAGAIDLRAVGGGGGGGATTFNTNTASPAVIAGSTISILGSGIITTNGTTPNTVTVTTTNPGVNGRIPISSATVGHPPIWANITSTGGSITVTNGDNTINIEAVGAGGGVNTFVTTAGNAVGVAGSLTVANGQNIVASGAGSTLTIATSNSINLPATTALNNGTYEIAGARFVHAFGTNNTFVGTGAGNYTLTTGSAIGNTGIGHISLSSLTTGASNTCLGDSSGDSITTSNQNVLIGFDAGDNITTGTGGNTAVGFNSLNGITTGSFNTCLGHASGNALTVADGSNILIANTGTAGISHQIRIGTQGAGNNQQNSCQIAGIYGVTVGGTNSFVFIDNTGKLGTVSSTGLTFTGPITITGNLTVTGSTTTGSAKVNNLTNGVVLSNASGNLSTSTPGTAGFVLTSTGATTAPTWQAGGGGGGSCQTACTAGALLGNTGNGAGSMAAGPGLNQNTAFGAGTMINLDPALSTGNSAFGFQALASNTIGSTNAAFGVGSLQSVTSGVGNVGCGRYTGRDITLGASNTLIGSNAGNHIITGQRNTCVGYTAGINFTGAESFNIIIGSDTIATTGESSVLRIGATTNGTPGAGVLSKSFIQGIRGITTISNNAIAVLVDSNGQLGTVSSSHTKKENIRDMASHSSNVMKLRPVVFNYISDASKTMDYGLIAEEVKEVMPDLVAHDQDGNVESVYYHKLPAMLLNELQKARDVINAHADTIDALRQELNDIKKQIAMHLKS